MNFRDRHLQDALAFCVHDLVGLEASNDARREYLVVVTTTDGEVTTHSYLNKEHAQTVWNVRFLPRNPTQEPTS